MNKIIKEVHHKSIESIEEEKIDISIFKKKTNSKTFRGFLIGKIKQARDTENIELVVLLGELYKKFDEYETCEKFRAKQWRGKSGVSYQIEPHTVIAIRFKKSDIGEEPKETRTEMTREEINRVSWAINKLEKEKPITTPLIAELVYRTSWKNVFSDRKKHPLLCEILGYLEYKNEIKYFRSGKVEILEQKRLK